MTASQRLRQARKGLPQTGSATEIGPRASHTRDATARRWKRLGAEPQSDQSWAERNCWTIFFNSVNGMA